MKNHFTTGKDVLEKLQYQLLNNYESDIKSEPDAWRRYYCSIKNESKLIRNDRDLTEEVLWKFCSECKHNEKKH